MCFTEAVTGRSAIAKKLVYSDVESTVGQFFLANKKRKQGESVRF